MNMLIEKILENKTELNNEESNRNEGIIRIEESNIDDDKKPNPGCQC